MNIGVTGGIGSGKSRVTEVLARLLGVLPISADKMCRKFLEVGGTAYPHLREQFDGEFFLESGELNRPALREAIFSDGTVREEFDAILHPMVRKEIILCHKNAEIKRENSVAEVPLLFEKGWQGDYNYIVVVFARDALCVTRIVERDCVTEEEARLAMKVQMALSEKCKLGDLVIDNSGSFDKTLLQLHACISTISRNPLFFRNRDQG